MTTPHACTRSHILDAEVFRHILVAQRRRTDRSNKPLIVLTITAGSLRNVDAALVWHEVVDVVSTVARGTDVVGWLERRTVIGVLLHDVPASRPLKFDLESRMRAELAKRLPEDTLARFSFNLHEHQAPPLLRDPEPMAEGVRECECPRARRRDPLYELLKRTFDITGSLTLLVVLAPVFLIIAALVKVKSPGPVLFRQARVGQNLKPFRMLKFRTMHVNADQTLHHQFVTQFIQSAHPARDCATDGLFKIVDDPRVTPVGRVLRKTSLDELPQFWNVLRGEMSLVGPRPPLPYEVEQYKAWHTRRVTEAKPGITGLWQVGGRSRTSFDEMVRLDLRYARSRSFWTDLKILLATPGAVFSGKGAC